MKRIMCLAVVGMSIVLAPSPRADAAYTVISLSGVHTTVTLDPDTPSLVNVPVTIYRVWANFTNPNDALIAWGGGGLFGSMTALATNSPTGFLNHIDGGLLPPTNSLQAAYWDSYFTIGATRLSQIPAGLGIGLFPLPGSPPDCQRCVYRSGGDRCRRDYPSGNKCWNTEPDYARRLH